MRLESLPRHVAIKDKFSRASTTSLTIWKHSLVYSYNGCMIFNYSGNLVFSIERYPLDPKNKVLLMDGARMNGIEDLFLQ